MARSFQNEDFLDELLRRPGKAQEIALAFQVSRHVDFTVVAIIHHETPCHVVVQAGVPDGFLVPTVGASPRKEGFVLDLVRQFRIPLRIDGIPYDVVSLAAAARAGDKFTMTG